ncbi:MAG TPA: hypothetical protein VMU40_06635 [Steroidobacteraceae bacterium]|nr:hypothetical protein [Steroidobacteraceae bacterium]
MNASHERADQLDTHFWDRLDRLESEHRRLQCEHESARRKLDRADPRETQEVRDAWRHYCEVIAELDRTTEEFDLLRRSAP